MLGRLGQAADAVGKVIVGRTPSPDAGSSRPRRVPGAGKGRRSDSNPLSCNTSAPGAGLIPCHSRAVE